MSTPRPEPLPDPARTEFDLGRVPPISSSVWWGTGVTRTFVFGPGGPDAVRDGPVEDGATIDLGGPDARPPADHAPARDSPGRYLLEGELGRGRARVCGEWSRKACSTAR